MAKIKGRTQSVTNNGSTQAPNIKKGVPQRSIFGLLLFVIYLNDIPQVFKFAKFILYADDANIIITRNNIAKIIVQLCDY